MELVRLDALDAQLLEATERIAHARLEPRIRQPLDALRHLGVALGSQNHATSSLAPFTSVA